MFKQAWYKFKLIAVCMRNHAKPETVGVIIDQIPCSLSKMLITDQTIERDKNRHVWAFLCHMHKQMILLFLIQKRNRKTAHSDLFNVLHIHEQHRQASMSSTGWLVLEFVLLVTSCPNLQKYWKHCYIMLLYIRSFFNYYWLKN